MTGQSRIQQVSKYLKINSELQMVVDFKRTKLSVANWPNCITICVNLLLGTFRSLWNLSLINLGLGS